MQQYLDRIQPWLEYIQQFMEQLSPFASNLIFAIILSIVFVVASIIVKRIIQVLTRRIVPTWSGVLGNVGQICTILLGLLVIIEQTGLLSAAILLTILTLFTAGASLSASNLISDSLATARILFFNYFGVDDVVTVAGDVHGIVTDINAFSTVIRTRDHDKVIVNNTSVIEDIIHVHTGYTGSEVVVRVPVCSDHDRNQVFQWLLDVGKDYPGRIKEEGFEPRVFHEYGSSSENYSLLVYVESEYETRHHYTALSIAAGNKLNENGVEVGEVNDNRNQLSGSLEFNGQQIASTQLDDLTALYLHRNVPGKE